jgi:predicted nucleic acid-binding protein
VAAELFVDTSAWYSLVVASDQSHAATAAALEERIRAGARVVTTNLVLAESHVLLMRRVNADVALRFLREVQRPPNVIVHSDADLERAAASDWLSQYGDAGLSLIDAVSFAVMRQRRITQALALDHHFAAAGFEMIPLPSAPLAPTAPHGARVRPAKAPR